MKSFFTLSLALLAASATVSAFAENPYAATGNEPVIGQTQILSNPGKTKANVLADSQLGAPDGWSMQCMNAAKNLESGSSIKVDGTAYVSIKLSNGAQNTITLPEGYVANAVTIYSVLNKDATDRICYWSEVDGEIIAAPETSSLTSLKDFDHPDVSYFRLKGDSNTFTLKNSGEQPFVVLVVDYSEATAPTPSFGEGTLDAPLAWPANNTAMIPVNGYFQLTFTEPVQVAGKATLNGTAIDMVSEGAAVKIPYTALTAATEYTLTVPAGIIGNETGANAELSYTFTTEPANTLFYSDFSELPYGYYELYGLPFITDNIDIIAKGSTNVTVEAGGMTFFSGTSGRIVSMRGNVNSTDPEADYGPYTEGDAGASNRCVQLMDGGNGLYVEFPEVEGPADVTLYLGNPGTTAYSIALKDELGTDLASIDLPAAKKIIKYTYNYPYKGTVKLRVYNNKNKVDINDVLIVKGEGEGIEKPVITDEEAPSLVKSWPSAAPYAPVEGTIVLEYSEPVVIEGKAVVNGVETDVVVNGAKATIAYSGLEKGTAYTVTIPAVADEAGNVLAASEMTINTEAADVLYYTDYNYFPFAYWDRFNMYPAEGADNGDILAKNSKNKTVEIAGLTYSVGSTAGRVVAMGKSNLVDDPDNVGGTQRCAQISGGGNDLYIQFPEVVGPCKLEIVIGNSTAKAFSFTLVNISDSETPVATFSTEAEKKMYKFEHTVEAATPVQFRLYNNGNQFNIHDMLLTKVDNGGQVGVAEVAAEAEAAAVYYNLQGVRVENPANGLYIRVRGNKVDKVIR